MKVVKHTVWHVFVHVALFTACALLIPLISTAIDGGSIWGSPAVLTASLLLVIACVSLMYRMKESVSGVLQSLGGMIFLPGMLNVVLSVFNADEFFKSESAVAGMAVLKPVAKFYIDHSVPTILSVAAVYMAFGGAMYWTGQLIDKTKNKLSWQNNN